MNQNYMKEKPILPLLLSLSLPAMISMMVNSLYNIIDSIFVAKIGENAMTAISLVYPIQNVIISLAFFQLLNKCYDCSLFRSWKKAKS